MFISLKSIVTLGVSKIDESIDEMIATEIPVITVSYNTPELINNLLTTFREKYTNPYYIIDGSDY